MKNWQSGIHKTFSILGILTFSSLIVWAGSMDRPEWAFFPAFKKDPNPKLDAVEKLHVSGSKLSFTRAEIDAEFSSPDWFPEEHDKMPEIVSRGNPNTKVRACASCHLPQGFGHPENSRLAGLSASYLERKMYEFRTLDINRYSGTKNMANLSKSLTDQEIKDSALYFSKLPVAHWTRVIETESVPKTFYEGTRRFVDPKAGNEPIGQRIIEVPEDTERVKLRDPHSGFITYVPVGSIKKGKALAESGDHGRFKTCTSCHGEGLKGNGTTPNIAGRFAGSIARQIYFYQTSAGTDPTSESMKNAVQGLTADDVINISAYVASLDPSH
jgi:cytochrome c553